MPKEPKPKRSGRRGDPVSVYPLTPEQAIKAVFAVKPEDVRRILASKPGKVKKE